MVLNKKIHIICFLILLCTSLVFMSACDDRVSVKEKIPIQTEKKVEQKNNEEEQTFEDAENSEHISEVSTEEEIENMPKKVENQKPNDENLNSDKQNKQDSAIDSQVELVNVLWDFVDEKVAKNIDFGFPSPLDEVTEVEYIPNEFDVLSFNSKVNGDELFNSIKHKGFEGFNIDFNRKMYEWDDFFGDLDYTEYERNLSVFLKENNIFEEDVIDKFEKHYRYYRDETGIYYEVDEILLGNMDDKIEDMTKKVMGKSCYFDAINNTDIPTYNPLVLKNEEKLIKCIVTEIDGNPAIYLETSLKNKLHKKWISIKHGLIIKEFIFSKEGLIKEIKTAINISKESIDNSIFYQPSDIEYKDITIFIYSMDSSGLEVLKTALTNTLPKDSFSITLEADGDRKLVIHSDGYKGEQSLKNYAVISNAADLNGEELELRSFYDGKYFNTVVDKKKLVERYESSVRQLMLFDFENTGFRGIEESEKTTNYIFENLGKGSVSGFTRFYEYEVDMESMKISKIYIYNKESAKDEEIQGDKLEYILTNWSDGDEAVFNIPDDYEVITNSGGKHYDGEYPPVWYE